MALRMGALYDALRLSHDIPEEAARLAAEEVANYDNKIASIDARLGIVQWMLGAVMALVLLVLGKVW